MSGTFTPTLTGGGLSVAEQFGSIGDRSASYRGAFLLDNSYATGGYIVQSRLPSNSLAVVDQVFIANYFDGTNFYVYNPSTKKIQAYVAATLAEVAATTDLSAITLQINVVGQRA